MTNIINGLKGDTGVSTFQLYLKGTTNKSSAELYLKFRLATIKLVSVVWLLVKLKLIVIPYIM